ncbi:MAG: hypothetical protein K9L02_03010 [Acholeplasmataceae bacterium]|nr:hypothetical protein [Acholeplasmataceae bacterium]
MLEMGDIMCYKNLIEMVYKSNLLDDFDVEVLQSYLKAQVIRKKKALMDYRQKKKRPAEFTPLLASSEHYIEQLWLPFLINELNATKDMVGNILWNINYFFQKDTFPSQTKPKYFRFNPGEIEGLYKTYNYKDLHNAEMYLTDVLKSHNLACTDKDLICKKLFNLLPTHVFSNEELSIFASAICYFKTVHEFDLKHKTNRHSFNISMSFTYDDFYQFLIIDKKHEYYTTKKAFFIAQLHKYLGNGIKYTRLRELLTLDNPHDFFSENDIDLLFKIVKHHCNYDLSSAELFDTLFKIQELSKKTRM